ncbi:hypothetical protein HYR99_10215 [Candidatus Poribacteria bacterium]|nr:hypothetical protein [Candidatus Poribacteria bacterium]
MTKVRIFLLSYVLILIVALRIFQPFKTRPESAFAQGHLQIQGVDASLSGTQPHTLSVGFIPPGDCAICHGAIDYHPYNQWQGSMMANASRDPLFLAMLAIANQDVPSMGGYCLRCHSPVGWLRGNSKPADGSQLEEIDLEGVQCDLCHRLQPSEKIGSGQYQVADVPAVFGPYTDPEFEPMMTVIGRDARYSEYVTKSELCGSCHDVTNPVNGFGTERTYTEWKQSDFAKEGVQCQDCHTPNRSQGGYVCRQTGTAQRKFREHYPQHLFVGGNTWIPTVLPLLYPELGREEAWANTQKWAEQMLQTAADVELKLSQIGKGLKVVVKVTNKTGHKLPTGFPEGRRMWLNVLAKDAEGSVFFESGRYDETSAQLIEDEQLKVYECLQGIKGHGVTLHFALNDHIVTDNRIPPKGFTPTSDTQPVGGSYAQGQHWDVTEYTVKLPEQVLQGEVTVVARLFYQTASRAFIEFLLKENRSDDWGKRLYDLWGKTGKSKPVLMATRSESISTK